MKNKKFINPKLWSILLRFTLGGLLISFSDDPSVVASSDTIVDLATSSTSLTVLTQALTKFPDLVTTLRIRNYGIGELNFDSTQSRHSQIVLELNDDFLKIDFNSIIATQFSGGNVQDLFNELKNFLNLGVFSKAPCGEFVNFFKFSGRSKTEYIVYSGINETSNSHYNHS